MGNILIPDHQIRTSDADAQHALRDAAAVRYLQCKALHVIMRRSEKLLQPGGGSTTLTEV